MNLANEDAKRLVREALDGSASAVDELVRMTQDQVYNLAVRMLWHPQDAEDATQEILIRVVTHLGDFRGESAYSTWVYRIASNYLLTSRQRRSEREAVSFDAFAADLRDGLVVDAAEPVDALLVKETKIGCSQAMLLCLDRDERIAYVLGEALGLHHEVAAEALDISPAAYRKRLSRARSRVRDFMKGACGWVDPAAACRCSRRAPRAIELGRVDPDQLIFADHPVRGPSPGLVAPTARIVNEMEQLEQVGAVFRSNPDYAAPGRIAESVKRLLQGGQLRVVD